MATRSIHIIGCGPVLQTRLIDALRERNASVDVTYVESPGEAVRRFGAATKSAVVFASLRDAGRSGLDVVRQLRAAGCRARIVLLTTSSQASYRRIGRQAGADACVDVARGLPTILRAARAP